MSTPTDPIGPGFITASGADAINAAMQMGEGNRRAVNNVMMVPEGPFNIKVTARDSGTGYYAWNLVRSDVSGVYYDDTTLSGDHTGWPAVEQNGLIVAAFPIYATARKRLGASTVGPILEFSATYGVNMFVRFTLTATLATTDATKSGCTVNSYWGGPSPGGTITVSNMAASSNNVFSGANGNKGLAVWDSSLAVWQIIQMQC